MQYLSKWPRYSDQRVHVLVSSSNVSAGEQLMTTRASDQMWKWTELLLQFRKHSSRWGNKYAVKYINEMLRLSIKFIVQPSPPQKTQGRGAQMGRTEVYPTSWLAAHGFLPAWLFLRCLRCLPGWQVDRTAEDQTAREEDALLINTHAGEADPPNPEPGRPRQGSCSPRAFRCYLS